MNDEDLLQTRLEELEAGAPLENCLVGLSPELAAALRTAAAVRQVALPALAPHTAAGQRAEVLAVASQTLVTPPAPSVWGQIVAWVQARTAIEWTVAAVFAPGLAILLVALLVSRLNPASPPPTVAEISPEAVVVVEEPATSETETAETMPSTAEIEPATEPETVAAVDTGFQTFLPVASNALNLDPQTAGLERTQGVVEVQTATGDWVSIGQATTLVVGQRVRTGAFSAATITFLDGSEARLAADSEISIDELNAQLPEVGFRTVVLTQWRGESEHHVAFRGDGGSRYEVKNPDGTGLARGTVFQVVVIPGTAARYIVLEGRVDVTSINITVSVLAGQITTIFTGQQPSTPAFRVTGEGEVSQIGTTWIVGGQTFITEATTLIVGNPQVGDLAYVEGHLAENGDKVADRITLLQPAPDQRFLLKGDLTAVGDAEWTVAGQTISLTAETLIVGEPTVGDVVQVSGRILADGTLLAETISLVDEELGLPFSFVGLVEAQSETAWTISGVAIVVDEDTAVAEEIAIGDTVRVTGFITADNQWLARTITAFTPEDDENTFLITGLVQAMDPWVVARLNIQTRPWTRIDDDIALGDRVQVAGLIMEDGTWVATAIEKIDDLPANVIILIGTLTSRDPWFVNGLSLIVTSDTLVGDVVVGQLVRVVIQLAPNGEWLVLSIDPLAVQIPIGCFTINAVVLGINGETIELEDWPAISTAGINIVGDLAPNTVILLHICITADGTIIITGDVTVITIIIIILPGGSTIPAPTGDTVICHRPPGNPNNGQTKTVGPGALNGHLGHGDTIGPCGSGGGDDDDGRGHGNKHDD